MDGGEIERFIKVWIIVITSLCYCYYISSKIPKGFLRLLSILPILYLFLTLPLNLTSFHLGGPTTFFLVWLSTFKLILFSFNQPPLFPLPNNIFHFISIASLPITPQKPNPRITFPCKKPNLPLSCFKIVTLVAIICSYDYREHMHPHLIAVLYFVHVYLGLQLLLALTIAPVRIAFDFEIEPQFNEPLLSTSLQDFWGRRWNFTLARILRTTVYNPVCQGVTSFVGPTYSNSIATLATFVVSGLMHEVIYFYLARVPPTWEVTWFFVLHGVCILVEVAVKKIVLRRGWRLHRVVSGVLTVAFLGVTSNWLMFSPLVRSGVDKKAILEYAIMKNFVKEKLRLHLFKY